MLSIEFIMLLAVVIIALSFDFINGFHDTANSIATSVSTRVLSPFAAILMAAVLNFIGALFSDEVAKTISKGLVDGALPQYVIASALLAAIIWNLITWYFGIPSSSSHALIGGLVGSSIMIMGIQKIKWDGVWNKVILPLITSPLAGFIFGYIFMTLLYKLLKKLSPQIINKWFSKLQILSAAFMAFSHGRNDAQKSMGIITLALVSAHQLDAHAAIPIWVKLSCAMAMALGTSIGGWKIIKTMGVNMIRLQPIGGFAAETSAALVIETASALGAPVSTTHIISTAIMGVGASKRFSAVRWAIARNIVWAWVLTIPVTVALGAGITLLLTLFGLKL